MNLSHDALQQQAFTWAHNTFPQIRGHLFACLNELKPIPGESAKAHMIRVQHAKAIGLRKGVLDLMLIMPCFERDAGMGVNITPAATYAFDAKIYPDKLHDDQLIFCEILRKCGGNGYAFYNLEEFQSIFTAIIRKHYGTVN